jgi:hypothetical protein
MEMGMNIFESQGSRLILNAHLYFTDYKAYVLLAIAIFGPTLVNFTQADDGQQFFAAAYSRGAQDPGVRKGLDSAGSPIEGLTKSELAFFDAGLEDFEEVEDVPDGLGPRMNLDSCGGCHSQPSVGGSSPAVNPQIAFASKDGGTDVIPPFLSLNGPVREVRFVNNPDGSADGGVHALFTISGRDEADGCDLRQPDFVRQESNGNLRFRIPTPLFGSGLIEQIPDSAIIANSARGSNYKLKMGIRGRPNHTSRPRISGEGNNNGNDGTIARFGWKAQNKSLLLFSGEAYNVEMGITSDLFQTERDETQSCQFDSLPNSVSNLEAATLVEAFDSISKFSFFMRFLAPPTPSATTPGRSHLYSQRQSTLYQCGLFALPYTFFCYWKFFCCCVKKQTC